MNPIALLAEAGESPRWLDTIARPEVLVFVIPIVSIVGAIAYKITATIIAHRERMAKIQQGIDPDAKDDLASRGYHEGRKVRERDEEPAIGSHSTAGPADCVSAGFA